MTNCYEYCICATAAEKAIRSLLEVSGAGTYRVNDPWLIAAEFLSAATDAQRALPILFATGKPLQFSHWGIVQNLEVVELHRGAFETRCEFSPLQPVNPIWAPIDSLMLRPSEVQLRREDLEGIRKHRHELTIGELHPYAICETPGFLLETNSAQTGG
jgi:hypothetical protein